MKRSAVLILLLLFALGSAVTAQPSAWCGYALIEGVDNIAETLPLLSLLTPDEGRPDVTPDQLLQVRVSLDGTKAIIEGCWRVFPTRDVVLNLLSLTTPNGREATNDRPGENVARGLGQGVTYSLFVPGGSRDDSAASVRQYLSEHRKEWELPEE